MPTATDSNILGIRLRAIDRVWLTVVALLLALLVADPGLATGAMQFVATAFTSIGGYLAAAVLLAAAAQASGADGLIARAFSGRESVGVAIAAGVGALSPFCSCGVIPLIAGMLGMGVPLAAVMAFWLASPLMDPSMFILTAAVAGTEFAVAKLLAAIAVGALGGYATLWIIRRQGFADPLRPGISTTGCGTGKVRQMPVVHWTFWQDAERRSRFLRSTRQTGLFLGKWLALAFTLEFMMLTWIPAETIQGLLGQENALAIPMAIIVGIPAYLNGYAAIALIGGLLEAGMSPAAGLAFLIAGGVTSIPAAMAVAALVRATVFGWYLIMAIVGALLSALAYHAWLLLPLA